MNEGKDPLRSHRKLGRAALGSSEWIDALQHLNVLKPWTGWVGGCSCASGDGGSSQKPGSLQRLSLALKFHVFSPLQSFCRNLVKRHIGAH